MFSLCSSYTAITGDVIKHSELIVDVSAGTVMLRLELKS